jgi:hypothetical protein
MELITILNRRHRSRGFIYCRATFSPDHKSIEISMRPRGSDYHGRFMGCGGPWACPFGKAARLAGAVDGAIVLIISRYSAFRSDTKDSRWPLLCQGKQSIPPYLLNSTAKLCGGQNTRSYGEHQRKEGTSCEATSWRIYRRERHASSSVRNIL